MRGREAVLEQQAHGVAFVAKRGLHRDQDIAKLAPQYIDGLAIAQLLAGRGAPVGLNFGQMPLAAHMVFGADEGVHIGVGTVLRRIAMQDAVLQRLHRFGHVHGIALCLHGLQGVEQGFEHRQKRGCASVAGIGREVEQDHGHAALGTFAATQCHQFGHPTGQHGGALGAGEHVFLAMLFAKGAGLGAAGAGDAVRAWASAIDHGYHRAVKLGDGHHDGGLHRQQASAGATPLVQGLKLHRVRRDIGHIEFGQHFFGGAGVVVGRATHQREAGERNNCVHRGLAVFQEIRINGGT